MRAVRVAGARRAGLAAERHRRRRSGRVGRSRVRDDRRLRRRAGVWVLPAAERARGRPCCPCRRRPSGSGVSLPVSGLPPFRCRCRCSRSAPDRARASVRVVVRGRRLRAPRAPAGPTCLRHRPCPRRCRCRSRCRCRCRPSTCGRGSRRPVLARLTLLPLPASCFLASAFAICPGAARQEHDSDRAENGKGRQRAGCECPRLVRKRVEGGHVFYFGSVRPQLERSLKTVSNVRPSEWRGRRSAQALPLLSVQSYPEVRVFANHFHRAAASVKRTRRRAQDRRSPRIRGARRLPPSPPPRPRVHVSRALERCANSGSRGPISAGSPLVVRVGVGGRRIPGVAARRRAQRRHALARVREDAPVVERRRCLEARRPLVVVRSCPASSASSGYFRSPARALEALDAAEHQRAAERVRLEVRVATGPRRRGRRRTGRPRRSGPR